MHVVAGGVSGNALHVSGTVYGYASQAVVTGTGRKYRLSAYYKDGTTTGLLRVSSAAGGTGDIAKICNNLILGINMIATSEGLSLGEKLGIDPKILSSILSVSTGRSWCVDTYNPRPGVLENVPASRDYNGGFMVSLIRKDLSIALEAAE